MKKKKLPFTLDQREKIELCLKNGIKMYHMAEAVGKPLSSIHREIRTNSINGLYSAERAHGESKNRMQLKAKLMLKVFSQEEESYILTRNEEGLSSHAISIEVGCCRELIRRFLRGKGIRKREKRQSMTVFERLQSLEEQVKILFETIKELQK